MTNLLLAIIIALSFNNNVYAQTDTTILEEVQQTDLQIVQKTILNDADFNEYLVDNGITQKELEDVLYSEYFANYVQFELSQVPAQDEIIASWDILEWHIQKIKNFINYIFNGDKYYQVNNNNNYFDNHNYHRHNNHNNNIMPPPPPPYNNWGQYQPNTNWNGYNNNNNNSSNENMCNCDCDNCRNCLKKSCN